MAGDNRNFWQDIEIEIDADPFLRIMSDIFNEKKAGSKNPLKPKAPFKLVIMGIIPTTSAKILTSENNVSSYLLIVDRSSKIPKRSGMEIITTEEVMYLLDMFQSRFKKNLAGGVRKEFH